MGGNLPRGSLKLAAEAAGRELLAGRYHVIDADRVARAALTAALPVIERAVLREAAKRILLLDKDDRERHRHANRPPWNNARILLRKLARGEPLPDLPQAGSQINKTAPSDDADA